MISQNDLYDISAALILIRNNIKSNTNCLVIAKIAEILGAGNHFFEDNQIRKAIASIEELDKEKWQFVYYNNVYVKHHFLKSDYIYFLLIDLCEQLKTFINQNNYEKAYDLADCIHCLPEILADNGFAIPTTYWKAYIKKYRKKWDKGFLKKYEKIIRRSTRNTGDGSVCSIDPPK